MALWSRMATATATPVTHPPLKHLLLAVANTGSKNCDLVGYASVLLSAADGSGSNGCIDSSIRVSYWQQTMDDALNW